MLPEQPACRHGKVRDVPRRTDWGLVVGDSIKDGDGPPLIAGGRNADRATKAYEEPSQALRVEYSTCHCSKSPLRRPRKFF